MRKLKTIVCLLCCLGCLAFLSACNEQPESLDVQDATERDEVPNDKDVNNVLTTGFLSYPYQYAERNGIELYHSSTQQELANWMVENDIMQQSPLSVDKETGLFSSGGYKLTLSDGEYYYRGENEDNYPNGFGVLSKASDTFQNLETIIYIGSFEDGKFSGYGLLFSEPTSEDMNVLYNLSVRGITDTQFQDFNYSSVNYVSFEGEFEDGSPNGEGNRFYCSLYYTAMASELMGTNTLTLADINYQITVGDFEDGEANGDVKVYRSGVLNYEGEMKNDERDGTGIQYQDRSNSILYEGNFKNNQYDGNGTLYDENGQVVYSGKWKNGDFA